MDSLSNQSGPLMKFWRIVAGGSESTGMTKLMVIIAAYILIGGLIFAFVV